MKCLKLTQLCRQIRTIYLKRNMEQFGGCSMESVIQMASEILRRAGGLPEAYRKKKWKEYRIILTDVTVWMIGLFALIATLRKEHSPDEFLENQLLTRFPGKCPYCSHLPCSCDVANKGERLDIIPPRRLWGRTLDSCQRLFKRIYPNIGLTGIEALVKLWEEFNEMITAAKEGNLDMFLEEAVDVISRIFAAANQIGRCRLGYRIERRYRNGRCCACNRSRCHCPDSVIAVNWRLKALPPSHPARS